MQGKRPQNVINYKLQHPVDGGLYIVVKIPVTGV